MEYNLHCKTVILIASVSLVYAINKGNGNSLGVTIPRGEINLKNGSNLEIFCTLTNAEYNSSSLIFYKNGDLVSADFIKIVNTTSIRLFVMTPPPSRDDYECRIKDNKNVKQLVGKNLVKIGFLPQNVTDFNCLAEEWLSIKCKWTIPKNFVETNYSLSYIDRAIGRLYTCPNTTVQKNSCEWSTVTTPLYRSYQKIYHFILRGENALGIEEFKYDFNHYANVIPSAPLNLSVSNMTSDSLTIMWNYTEMRWFPPGLVHLVKYKTQWDSADYWHVINTSDLPIKNKTYVVTLSNLLYAHTLYDIRVFVRSATGVEPYKWSKPAVITVRNAGTIPGRAPKTDIGSYEIVRQGDVHNDILIYWQQIPQYLENGEKFSYKVYLLLDGVEVKTVYPDIKKSCARFNELPYNKNYTFKIVSSNKNGESSHSSEIFIPSLPYRPHMPESFIQVDYDHGLYQLSWKPAKSDKAGEDIESYTLFWCEDKRYVPHQCEGFLNWTRLPSNVTAKNLTLISDGEVIYQFAISANTKGASSGMVWASCSLYPEEVAANGKMKNMWINKIGSNFMEVNWKLDCSYRISTQHFIIRYCPIGPPQNNTCKEPIQNKTIEYSYQDSSDIMSYNLTGLKPYTTYMITIAVKKNNDREGQPSSALYNTTLEGAPDKPPQNVSVTEVTDSSITLSWIRPEPLNGVFQENKVFLNNNFVKSVHENRVTLTQLDSFVMYNITVSACTRACSPNSSVITVVTKTGFPGEMQVPNVDLGTSKLSVTWFPPQKKGGKIDYYEIKHELFEDKKSIQRFFYNATEQQYEIDASECINRHPKLSFEVSVRAVNIDNGSPFTGPWSPPSTGNCYRSSLDLYTIMIVIVVGIICFIFIVVSTCFCTKCLYKKCKNMQDIRINVSSKLTEISTVKEKEPCSHVALNGWSSQIQEGICNLPSPDQQLLLEKMGKEDNIESNIDEIDESVGEVDRESSGCGSGHGSVSSSINGAAQISSDSGTEADQRASSPDVFSDSPSRMCLLRQRNVSNNNVTAAGEEGYCRVAAPTASNYVAVPSITRGYVMHSPTWTNTNQLPPSKGYVVAVSSLTKAPASTYCVLGRKAPQTFDIPYESNHEYGFQDESQVNRDNTNYSGVSDSRLDSVNTTLSL